MNPRQQWLDVKEGYLKQVEKNLAKIDHPRRVEILSDVNQHLESKYAELPEDRRNWEGYQRIITEMGPPQEYAELLAPEPAVVKSKFGINELLAVIFVLTLILIGAYLVYTAKKNSVQSVQNTFVFELDERVLGKWVTVDFVNTIEQFNPAKKYWRGDLFLKSLTFNENGTVIHSNKTDDHWQENWTKGRVEPQSERPAFYYMRDIGGQTYMFFEWISGDVTDRGSQPAYYVLKKATENEKQTTDSGSKATTFITFSKIDLAWQYSRGKGVKIAVLDWLFDMSPNASAKYVDAVSLVPGEPVDSDEPWHGEWMANIVNRIAPEAMIIPIRCRPYFESEEKDKDEDGRYIYEKYLIEGIRYAADHGAAAVTNSMGPVKHCNELQDAIDYAEQKGTIFIDVHPEYTSLTDKFLKKENNSSCDKRIIHAGVVSVPGHRTRREAERDIYVWPYDIDPVYKDGWGFSNGPPIVAGVIALMKSANPALTPQDVRRIITETAYVKDGFAVLDAHAAVIKATAQQRAPLTPETDINQKLLQLDFKTAGIKDIVELFGKPEKYVWGEDCFREEDLPASYIAVYPGGLSFCVINGKIDEIRHEGPTGYVFKDRLQVGSALETVIEVLGTPNQTITGNAVGWKDGILYKDIDGKEGFCYYQRSDQNVRLFFSDYKVAALYVTNPYIVNVGNLSASVDSVQMYDDVRFKDLTKIQKLDETLIHSLQFNQETIWPELNIKNEPVRSYADNMMKDAMNPGLGIRTLHAQRITGKGVNVAIIDQPLYLDHPAFSGKIAAYNNLCSESESSMHGPSVASLLVGTNCGTAPGARLYYAAAPSWTGDTAYQAQALEWIIEQNKSLTPNQKIRVISVSAAPSGPGSPFDKNNELWDKACQTAESQGILVLDCTSHHGFIAPCFFENGNIEDPSNCHPGLPLRPMKGDTLADKLFVPTCPRTSAEEYEKGKCTYAYWGQGGLSWAIPYTAGVLAMGFQVWPQATPEQLKNLLFESAYISKEGVKIINPPKFIEAVESAKKASSL